MHQELYSQSGQAQLSMNTFNTPFWGKKGDKEGVGCCANVCMRVHVCVCVCVCVCVTMSQCGVRILVFPAASSPSMSILMSFLPNNFASFFPMFPTPGNNGWDSNQNTQTRAQEPAWDKKETNIFHKQNNTQQICTQWQCACIQHFPLQPVCYALP